MNTTVATSSFHELFGNIGIGFGTAALGGNSAYVVTHAIKNGFRKFDTAEESDYWYDQATLGSTLETLFNNCVSTNENDDIEMNKDNQCELLLSNSCWEEGLQISTKIPPWELTSVENIRSRALASRNQLVGFCSDIQIKQSNKEGSKEVNQEISIPYPLDVYYIHAPQCWRGWHTRCENVSRHQTLPLREAWMALEAVVELDKAATRIGLSNVNEYELLDIIKFVKSRQSQSQEKNNNAYFRNRNLSHDDTSAPPRMPDVLQSYADPLHPAKRLRQICQEYNIEFVAYSTLGTQHRDHQNPVLYHPNILFLSRKHDRSTAEVVLSWAMSKGMSVIPRSGKKHHIQELANMMKDENIYFLEEEDLAFVDSMALD